MISSGLEKRLNKLAEKLQVALSKCFAHVCKSQEDKDKTIDFYQKRDGQSVGNTVLVIIDCGDYDGKRPR